LILDASVFAWLVMSLNFQFSILNFEFPAAHPAV